MDRLPAAMQLGEQNARAHEAGQNDMFGLAQPSAAHRPPARAARAAGVERGACA